MISQIGNIYGSRVQVYNRLANQYRTRAATLGAIPDAVAQPETGPVTYADYQRANQPPPSTAPAGPAGPAGPVPGPVPGGAVPPTTAPAAPAAATAAPPAAAPLYDYANMTKADRATILKALTDPKARAAFLDGFETYVKGHR